MINSGLSMRQISHGHAVMLDDTHGSTVFPHHYVFVCYTETRSSNYIQRLAILDKNARAADLLTTFLATIFDILQATSPP